MVTSQTIIKPELNSSALVGTWRRFGLVGPVYEVIGVGDKLSNGDLLMRIRVLESGEELDYRLSDIIDDPKER